MKTFSFAKMLFCKNSILLRFIFVHAHTFSSPVLLLCQPQSRNNFQSPTIDGTLYFEPELKRWRIQLSFFSPSFVHLSWKKALFWLSYSECIECVFKTPTFSQHIEAALCLYIWYKVRDYFFLSFFETDLIKHRLQSEPSLRLWIIECRDDCVIFVSRAPLSLSCWV